MRPSRAWNFTLCFIMNIVISWRGLIPAAVLLALHFAIDLSLGWFWLALCLWVAAAVFWTLFIAFAASCRRPTPYRENKNPYSARSGDLFAPAGNAEEKNAD